MRKWRFTAGYGTTSQVSNSSTEFWGEWKPVGEPPVFSYVVHAQYDLARDLTNATASQYALRRNAIEARMQTLMRYKSRQGTLDIDWDKGAPFALTLNNVVLDDITPVQQDDNLILEFDLVFSYPTPGTLLRTLSMISIGTTIGNRNYQGLWQSGATYAIGQIVSSSGILYAAKQANRNQRPAVNAIWGIFGTALPTFNNTYLLITPSRNDNTVFKKVSRGQSIRLQAVPDNTTLTLTGIRQNLVVAGALSDSAAELARRQASEAMITSWIARIGTEIFVAVDGVALGILHLNDAKPSKLDIPDAITYDLVFLKGYLNG